MIGRERSPALHRQVYSVVAGRIWAFAACAEVYAVRPGLSGPCHSERGAEATREEVLRMWVCTQIVTWLGQAI